MSTNNIHRTCPECGGHGYYYDHYEAPDPCEWCSGLGLITWQLWSHWMHARKAKKRGLIEFQRDNIQTKVRIHP